MFVVYADYGGIDFIADLREALLHVAELRLLQPSSPRLMAVALGVDALRLDAAAIEGTLLEVLIRCVLFERRG